MGDEKDGWSFDGAREISRRRLESVIAGARPGRTIREVHQVAGGLSNANYRVTFEHDDTALLVRACVRAPEAAAKEADLYAHLRGVVPVPEVVYRAPAEDSAPPCLVLRWIEGIPLRDLRATGDTDAIAQAARSVGHTLAAIGRVTFDRGGFIGPGLAIEPLGGGIDSTAGFIAACAASEAFLAHAGESLTARLAAFLAAWGPRAAVLDGGRALVHSDFNSRNILVHRRADGWAVAGVIDWEFALAASPLFDVGNLLRYESPSRKLLEPHFSAGFREAGGDLPEDWRALSRFGDLAALCELLSRPGLSATIVAELRALVEATLHDPRA